MKKSKGKQLKDLAGKKKKVKGGVETDTVLNKRALKISSPASRGGKLLKF